MTGEVSAEHADSPKMNSNSVRLEPLDYGGQTLYWDAIEQCVRESIGADEVSIANALGAIRRKEMVAWAVWRDGRVGAVMVTRPVEDGYSGGAAMLVYGLHGDGVTLAQWIEAGRQFEAHLLRVGIRKLLAYTTSPRVKKIAKALGWNMQTFCWKDLGNE